MKKFLSLLLIFTLCLGGFTLRSFAEESGDVNTAADESTGSGPSFNLPPQPGSTSEGTEPSEEPSEPDDTPSAESSEDVPGDVSAEEPSEAEPSLDETSDESSIAAETSDETTEDESSNAEETSGETSDETTEDTSGEHCAVSVKKTGSGQVTYDSDVKYAVGDTLTLTLDPTDGMGVKSVAVNGEAVDVPFVKAGESIPLDITVEGDTEIEVEFAEAIRVIVAWGLGGTVTANGKEIPNNAGFMVIRGSDLSLRIMTNANQAIDTVTNYSADITQSIRGGIYEIKDIQDGYYISVNFRETGSTEVNKYTITVNAEGGGTVSPSGRVSVEQGSQLVLELTPDEGFRADSVTYRGKTEKLTGNTYTVKEVYEDATVTVRFVSSETPDESSSVTSSAPESSEEPERPTGGGLTREDLEKLVSGDELRVDLSSQSIMTKDALEYINTVVKEGKSVFIGVSGKYWWTLPAGAAFSTAAVTDDGVNLGVMLNDGEDSDEMNRLVKLSLSAGTYDFSGSVTVERLSSAAFPAGTKIKVYMGDSFEPGDTVEWLRYDTVAKSFAPMNGADGLLAVVDRDRSVSLEMPEMKGMLVKYTGDSRRIDLSWDGAQCGLSVPGDASVGDDGISSMSIVWKDGFDLKLDVDVKDGFEVKSISSDKLQLKLSAGGKDVTENGANGAIGKVTVTAAAPFQNGAVSITTGEETGGSTKASAAVPWDIIVLVAVIVVAVVAGGIVFVVKWRQSGDDDDDDDYEDDTDDDSDAEDAE